jgi:hypothetical protein
MLYVVKATVSFHQWEYHEHEAMLFGTNLIEEANIGLHTVGRFEGLLEKTLLSGGVCKMTED